jgi:hypothetical protein
MRVNLAGSVVILATALLLMICGCDGRTADVGRPRIVESPAGPGSQAPNLAVGLDGVVYLTWVEPTDDGHALRFSAWRDDRWTRPKTVAEGSRWFVNWADFPSMAALADGTLAAHWLVRSGEASYAYDVYLALSHDGGNTWSEPFRPHRDATETEHGFVSLVSSPDGHFEVIWLDGRKTAETPRGAMTLRYAALHPDGSLEAEAEVDSSVCDCCSTDAMRTGDGTLLTAYRDRTASEVRDISVSLLQESEWSAPRTVHADNWEIAACPVNGPAVAGLGDLIVVAWFTAASDRAQVQAAFSSDGGRTFGRPLRVDDGNPLGRVDVVMLDEESALVSWLERDPDRTRIALRRVAPSGVSQSMFVATTSQARSSGFPRMAVVDDDIILAWTEDDEPSRIRTAVIAK